MEEVIGGQKTVQGYEAMMMAVASSSFAEKVVVVGVLCEVAEEEGNGGHHWKAQFVVCHDGVRSLRETQSAIDEDAGRDKVDSKRQAELVKHVKEKAV